MVDHELISTGGMDNYKFVSTGREVVRIRPDGTWWIEPTITEKERAEIFELVVGEAAKNFKKAKECEQRHEA